MVLCRLSGGLFMDHVDDVVGFLAGEAARQGCYGDGREYGCTGLGSNEELPCKVVFFLLNMVHVL
jgi:hypothetical protein